MRIQEFYESNIPSIRNNYFTLERFMDCYADHFGNFSYCTDWIGFNLPGHVITKFYTIFAHDLLIKEQNLHSLIHQHVTTPKFYVIGTATSDRSVINHELAHALYYLCPSYKLEITGLIGALSKTTLAHITKVLLDGGYAQEVIFDEIQAYLATSTKSELVNVFGRSITTNICSPFKSTFKAHCQRNNIKTTNTRIKSD